ncbi:MAG: SH3 domain-containing protein [Ferruginibacter sp.]
MALQDKYKQLIDEATRSEVRDLQVREQNGVLYVDGTAATGDIKDSLWNTYNSIDPNFAGGDLVLDIKTAMDANVTSVRVNTESSNLNIRKGPGTDQPIVGKAAHGEMITLVSRSNDQWWQVRTKDGEEGYAYSQYLEADT